MLKFEIFFRIIMIFRHNYIITWIQATSKNISKDKKKKKIVYKIMENKYTIILYRNNWMNLFFFSMNNIISIFLCFLSSIEQKILDFWLIDIIMYPFEFCSVLFHNLILTFGVVWCIHCMYSLSDVEPFDKS